jgi:hypothetical protein
MKLTSKVKNVKTRNMLDVIELGEDWISLLHVPVIVIAMLIKKLS